MRGYRRDQWRACHVPPTLYIGRARGDKMESADRPTLPKTPSIWQTKKSRLGRLHAQTPGRPQRYPPRPQTMATYYQPELTRKNLLTIKTVAHAPREAHQAAAFLTRSVRSTFPKGDHGIGRYRWIGSVAAAAIQMEGLGVFKKGSRRAANLGAARNGEVRGPFQESARFKP